MRIIKKLSTVGPQYSAGVPIGVIQRQLDGRLSLAEVRYITILL